MSTQKRRYDPTCYICGIKENEASLFPFPDREPDLQKWLAFCNLSAKPPSNTRLCSIHFDDEDLITTETRKLLTFGCVPKHYPNVQKKMKKFRSKICASCKDRSVKGGLSYFSFPKDELQRSAWAEFCDLQLEDITRNHLLCHLHFSADKVIDNTQFGGIRKLRFGAVPTIKIKKFSILHVDLPLSPEHIITTPALDDIVIPLSPENTTPDEPDDIVIPLSPENVDMPETPLDNSRTLSPENTTMPTSPCDNNLMPSSDDTSSVQPSTPIQTSPSRRLCYAGDLRTSDFVGSPRTAKHKAAMVRTIIRRKNLTIKSLRQRNKQLLEKIRTAENFMKNLIQIVEKCRSTLDGVNELKKL